uniref:Uncharacterized protein n=1 Tax=Columba livia TaxID=8932 RepID=R7VSG1_COLLI
MGTVCTKPFPFPCALAAQLPRFAQTPLHSLALWQHSCPRDAQDCSILRHRLSKPFQGKRFKKRNRSKSAEDISAAKQQRTVCGEGASLRTVHRSSLGTMSWV